MFYINKKKSRVRRSLRTRKKISTLEVFRLVVHKSNQHIYAQIISKDNCDVLVSASTLEKSIANQLKNTGNKYAASIVGRIIAERALIKGIINVSFDRSGFKYHGRVKELADYARQFGLRF